MEILVSGSMAYDRIMDFPGHFADHIVPEKIHTINLSFTVNGLVEKFGGTAGKHCLCPGLAGGTAAHPGHHGPRLPQLLSMVGAMWHCHG